MLVTTPPAGAQPHGKPQSPAAREAAGTERGGAGRATGPGPGDPCKEHLESYRATLTLPARAAFNPGLPVPATPRAGNRKAQQFLPRCRNPRRICFLPDVSYQFYKATPSRDGSSQRFIRGSRNTREGARRGRGHSCRFHFIFLFVCCFRLPRKKRRDSEGGLAASHPICLHYYFSP